MLSHNINIINIIVRNYPISQSQLTWLPRIRSRSKNRFPDTAGLYVFDGFWKVFISVSRSSTVTLRTRSANANISFGTLPKVVL
jgi:hypothetical protein